MAAKKWMKFRHRVVTRLLYMILKPYSYIKYGIKVEKFKEQGGRQYLVVFNHQTAFDQFFVGMAFKGPIYYLASEDLFSNGWVSDLIRWLIAPIPIRKQTTDVAAVKNCIRVAREGGTIALAPEGNRTYDGKPVHINPAIAPLAKKLGLPIAIFRIEGGYGVHPRWSDVVRRGKMRGLVSCVIEPESFKDMSDSDLFALIKDEIDVKENNVSGEFHHKNNAEYLERAIYVCPDCGLSSFESRRDIIECKKCGKKVRHLPTKELEGVNCEFPFHFVSDWYDYQCNFVNSLNILGFTDVPLYRDRAAISEVIVYERKNKLCEDAQITLYGDRIIIEGDYPLELHFNDVSALTVLGRNKLNIYINKKLYQLKSDKRFNALKYVNIFYRYKNLTKENVDGKFLGL